MVAVSGMTYSEQAFLLGQRKTLVCIATQPVTPRTADGPAVVILNAGIIHRVGPNRMSVKLARALASAGVPVLRFDLSGIGDSESRADGLSPLEANLSDIREVLDGLAARGATRFVLLGLCSGADYSVAYGADDPRVAGLVLLDPSIPKTFRFHFNHYARRVADSRSWRNALAGKNRLLRSLASRMTREPDHAGSEQEAGALTVDSPEVREYLEKAYGKVLARGGRIMAVLTAGLQTRHNYREQLTEAFPRLNFGTNLSLHYFERSDHEFTAETDQVRLIDQVVSWIATESFPEVGHAASS